MVGECGGGIVGEGGVLGGSELLMLVSCRLFGRTELVVREIYSTWYHVELLVFGILFTDDCALGGTCQY